MCMVVWVILCLQSNSLQTDTWQDQALVATGRRRIRWVQKKYMIYNYCTDLKRFPQGLHPNVRDQSSAKGTKAPSYDWCLFFFWSLSIRLIAYENSLFFMQKLSKNQIKSNFLFFSQKKKNQIFFSFDRYLFFS